MGQLVYCPKCGNVTVHEKKMRNGVVVLRHGDEMWECVNCKSYGAIGKVVEMGKMVRE